MAQQVTISCYGTNYGAYSGTQGVLRTFATQSFELVDIASHPLNSQTPAVTTLNGITMLTAIVVSPMGLNQKGLTYFTPTAIDTVATASNA